MVGNVTIMLNALGIVSEIFSDTFLYHNL